MLARLDKTPPEHGSRRSPIQVTTASAVIILIDPVRLPNRLALSVVKKEVLFDLVAEVSMFFCLRRYLFYLLIFINHIGRKNNDTTNKHRRKKLH